jgi:hypothetical protein
MVRLSRWAWLRSVLIKSRKPGPVVLVLTAQLLFGGCSDGDGKRVEGSPPSTTAASAPDRPVPVEVSHGDKVFGVYLSVERGETPTAETSAAEAEAKRQQWHHSGGDIDCDQGAREALRLDPARKYYSIAIYFRTREDAQEFVDLYEPGVVGIAPVTVFCLD